MQEGIPDMTVAVMERGNLELHPISREHILPIMDYRNAQMDILRQYRHLNEEDQDRWFASLTTDRSQVQFSMYLNKQFCGYCGLTNIDYINRRAEISFLINGQPNDTEVTFCTAIHLLCDFGFNNLGMNKIYTETFAFREAHIRTLGVCGFITEGILRMHQFKKGKFHDSIIQSMLKGEWEEQRRREGP
jgi:RimJ/RimL family protein N-acetyltransferase